MRAPSRTGKDMPKNDVMEPEAEGFLQGTGASMKFVYDNWSFGFFTNNNYSKQKLFLTLSRIQDTARVKFPHAISFHELLKSWLALVCLEWLSCAS